MISSSTLNIHIQTADAQPIYPCNPQPVYEKEHDDIANFLNDTSSALKTRDVKVPLQVLEKAQILLENMIRTNVLIHRISLPIREMVK